MHVLQDKASVFPITLNAFDGDSVLTGTGKRILFFSNGALLGSHKITNFEYMLWFEN